MPSWRWKFKETNSKHKVGSSMDAKGRHNLLSCNSAKNLVQFYRQEERKDKECNELLKSSLCFVTLENCSIKSLCFVIVVIEIF